MANAFDFEINADENVTKVIDEINAKLNSLNPNLAKTKEGLKFGGSESTDGVDVLGTKLRDMSRYAKDNVQHIGDIVPPLKNVGELATKYAGIGAKIGGVGMAAYGISKGFQLMNDMGKEAYDFDVAAKNSAMNVPDFTRIAGAMRYIGISADDAKKSVESFYGILNHPLQGRRDEARAQLTNMGVPLYENEHGTIDVYKTFPEVVKAMQKYPSDVQNTIAEKIGLDEHGLALARKGPEIYQELLNKSDRNGNTRSQADNDKINQYNDKKNELDARLEGITNRAKIAFANFALGDGYDYMKEQAEKREAYSDTLFSGDKKGDLRDRALNDIKFMKSLSFGERYSLQWGEPDKDLEKKINDRFSAAWEKEKSKHDADKIKDGIPQPQKVPEPAKIEPPKYPDPYGKPVKDSFGLRIKNPGNVRDAPNGIGYVKGQSGTFVKFANSHDGNTALARQLMLYGDRKINTLNRIISTYAPKKDRNDTQAYIDFVSKETSYPANQPLDLHEPQVLEKLINSMIKQENHGQQPFSQKEITDAITAAIFDPKWQGLRDKYYLSQQRIMNQPVPPESERPSSSIFANQANNSELAQNIADAIQSAIGENKLQVEITIVSNKTGERQQFNAKTGGRVTTSMQYP
ncbi:hypothetical protein [Photorhabdus heterorhabditis]|uniref:hypothetical protein n=1 Tax=Photorhabdus heterorhabditis TaxID=880156 RepID=UPI001BD40BAB|nr:hypothetical protein [Photorhabdus heterorhabditis]MBS9442502.1 hypothetical protein [Photorhabdus heterorhabditis]